MWWLFTSCSDLCWSWCPVEMYRIHIKGKWMGTSGWSNDGVDGKASIWEGWRTYGQSQVQTGEEDIRLGPEPTGKSSYAKGKNKFSPYFPFHCCDWTISLKPFYIDWCHSYGATTVCAPMPWASRSFVHRHLVPSVISRGALSQATPETSVSEERKWARNVWII
jgi:hypothetical protein